MAQLFSREATGAYGRTSPVKAPASVVQTPVKRVRGSFISTGANTAAGDTIVIGRLPIGAVFDHGRMNSSVGATAVNASIGTAALPAKYRAAAAMGAADTPVPFGIAAIVAGDPLTAEEEVVVTLSAALPAGTHVFDIYYSSVAS